MKRLSCLALALFASLLGLASAIPAHAATRASLESDLRRLLDGQAKANGEFFRLEGELDAVIRRIDQLNGRADLAADLLGYFRTAHHYAVTRSLRALGMQLVSDRITGALRITQPSFYANTVQRGINLANSGHWVTTRQMLVSTKQEITNARIATGYTYARKIASIRSQLQRMR